MSKLYEPELEACQVTIAYDPLWKPLEWAIANCPSYITNQSGIKPKTITYYFSDAKDATYFRLYWM